MYYGYYFDGCANVHGKHQEGKTFARFSEIDYFYGVITPL